MRVLELGQELPVWVVVEPVENDQRPRLWERVRVQKLWRFTHDLLPPAPRRVRNPSFDSAP